MIAEDTTQTVNLLKVLEWFSAEGSDIQELSLSGNMDIAEMRARKVQWKTADKPDKKLISYDQDYEKIQLEGQRIRVFKVTKPD